MLLNTAADEEIRLGNEPVKFYHPAQAFAQQVFLLGGEIFPAFAFVLVEVIPVFILRNAEQRPRQPAKHPQPVIRTPRYLKIYDVGFAVLTNKNVFRFFDIDMRHSSSMNFFENHLEAVEIIIVDLADAIESRTGDVFAHKTETPYFANDARNLFDVFEAFVIAQFALDQKRRSPFPQKITIRIKLAGLGYEFTGGTLVYAGYGVKIFLENVNTTVRLAFDLYHIRQDLPFWSINRPVQLSLSSVAHSRRALRVSLISLG